MKLNIPIFLTIFRVILIPFFVITFYLPFDWAPFLTTLLFFIAGVTDPVADKIMVVAGLVLVVEYNHTFWITIPAIVVISREIIISALREWMAELGSRSKVAVSWLGKVKTTSQMLALGGLLWRYNTTMEIIAIILLYVAAILTIWSMLQYLNAAKDSLLEDLRK